MATLAELLPPQYGYVMIVASLLVFTGLYLGSRVMAVRKQVFTGEFLKTAGDLLDEHKKTFPNAPFMLGYPDMGNGRYSDKLTYEQWYKLNNAQRGHYNFIESVWGAMGLLLVGGLFHPVVFAALGAGYIVGRVIYAIGYMSASGPKGREAGAVLAALSLLGMVGMGVYTGVKLLKP